jgi:purine-cytosine permease-like protein
MEANENVISERLEWFGGNKDALEMFHMFIYLAHIWDDLVDKDKEVSEDAINKVFSICLIYLPLNNFYRQIQYQIIPMWITIISSYEAANKFERDKDQHGIEISHGLRYAAGNIIAYAIFVCVGAEKAKDFIPEMWKTVVFERFDDYRKEHLSV